MKKQLVASMLVLSLAIAMSTGCGKKEEVQETTETTAVASTEDQFAISDSLNTDLDATEPETRDPMETAVAIVGEDARADGTSTVLLANGDISVGMNKPGQLANNTPKETEVAPTGEVAQIAKTLNESTVETEAETEAGEVAEETKVPSKKADISPSEFVQNQQVKLSEEECVSYDNVVEFWVENPDLSEEYLEEMLISDTRFPSLTETEQKALLEEIKSVYPHDPAETVAYDTYWD